MEGIGRITSDLIGLRNEGYQAIPEMYRISENPLHCFVGKWSRLQMMEYMIILRIMIECIFHSARFSSIRLLKSKLYYVAETQDALVNAQIPSSHESHPVHLQMMRCQKPTIGDWQ